MEPRAFLRTRYRAKLTQKPDADHWSGGQAYHQGARCPTCKIRLLLLWDLNCKDPRFPRRKFGPLQRLPLYFCFACSNMISYQVIDQTRIRIHSFPRQMLRPRSDFPYEPYPEFFERRGLLLLEGAPEEIRRIYLNLVAQWQSGDDDDDESPIPQPTRQEQKILTAFFGHPVPLPMCFFHHQLGGKPLRDQWACYVFECPNPACEGSINDQKHGRKRPLKFLAGILNDPLEGLPFFEAANEVTRKKHNYFPSVQYHICDCCWTLLGCNISD